MGLSLVSILSIVIFSSLVILCFSIYLNIKFGLILLNMEDSIEECLDILDERYYSMSKVLEIPIFFDSIEVRQVIEDIRKSRESLLKVANTLAKIEVEEDQIERVE